MLRRRNTKRLGDSIDPHEVRVIYVTDDPPHVLVDLIYAVLSGQLVAIDPRSGWILAASMDYLRLDLSANHRCSKPA